MDLFRVRLNCIDHYQATPSRYDPQLRNDVRPSQLSKGTKVPVVRIFGSTETGQKVCAHVHGAFPYLYVEYQGGLAPEEVGIFIYRLHLSIDHALAVSYRRDQYGDNAAFVARITLVKGIPFYGFHVGYRFFLKIYMFNPIVMTRLADLLQQGVIMKRKFQPYEAHLQYLLQFMVDYNLYGCDYLDSSKTTFRSPVPEHDQGSNSSHLWHGLSVPSRDITDDPTLPRVSHCSIEVDICVQNIVNRKMVKERPLHHDFIERISPIPKDLKYVYSMAGLWSDEAKRRRRQMLPQQGNSPFPPEALVTMSADPRDSQPQGWIHEKEYREEIDNQASEETANLNGRAVDFSSFTKPSELEHDVKTALQSVEDLYPSTLMPALGLSSSMSQSTHDPASSIEVDEEKALEVQLDSDAFFPNDSDEEVLMELVEAEHLDEARLQGQAGIISPSQAAADLLHPYQPISGLCPSVVKTGRLPAMPVSEELLKAAEDEGLIGRVKKPDSLGSEKRAALKRSGSAVSMINSPPKRIKREMQAVAINDGIGNLFGVTQAEGDEPEPSSRRRLKPDSAKRRNRPSPVSDPAHSNQTLNFAIVKDQHDPNTKPRLSQSSSIAPSQRSGNATSNKQVSFSQNPSSQDIGYEVARFSTSPLSPLGRSKTPSQALKLQQAAAGRCRRPTLVFAPPPPSLIECVAMSEHNLPDVIYQDAFYSEEKDVSERNREYAGREYRLDSNTVPFLPPFDPTGSSPGDSGVAQAPVLGITSLDQQLDQQRRNCSWKSWEFALPPPSYQSVTAWLDEEKRALEKRMKESRRPVGTPRVPLSQIDGPTPKNKHGFKYTQKQKSTSVEHEVQYMSTMSLEIHVNTRGKFVPNPEEDEVQCIFWACKSDETARNTQESNNAVQSGILVVCADGLLTRQVQQYARAEVIEENSELDLMVRMVEIVKTHDPDVLTGFEVHGSSWGYLIERARCKYDYNLCDEFSRMKTNSHGRFGKNNDRWGFNTTSTIRVTGRHMINIWRAMRGELNLLQYTMENVAWHLLHRRVPHYSWKTLTQWYKSGKFRDLSKLLRYYQTRTRLDIQVLEANELIPRTSEQARLLGVDFFSVFSRGSQFKVESIMFRIAKPENFMLVSPSRRQVGGQNALECLPLVMEPQSAFYNSPVLVLDFQSLYPSVMIAYNYCYSTFLGRIKNWRGTSKMGFTEYSRQKGLLVLLQDYVNIAPNGMMYVKAEVRKSLLAKMLTEILETRVMVKSGMKKDKDDKTLQQLLNNRQLALKLLANVTYGYTSASFSGRMPCSEIADSIVQTARETLERAIAYIHSEPRWGAEVVYGDTDSLFVHLKGRTRDQAFDIGNEIAKAVTDMNPRPIKLKFEKVYHPCVLLAKKRYVGYKYESKDQVKPEFDAKGIETVRRDGTPAEQKMEEKALRLLFETADLSQIKKYFQKQCDKIMRGAVSVQDFCFAREVRLGTYSDKGPPPPGALISTRKMLEDARAEPQYGERVPYVVITGAPGARLIDRCVAPEDLLANPHWQLDAEYYISKNLIPPLERIFNLVGANVRQWYDEMPKVQRVHRAAAPGRGSSKKPTLESYMRSTHCLVCNARFADGGHSLCPRCRAAAPASLLALQTRLAAEERGFQEVLSVCRSCSGMSPLEDVRCDSRDCPVFWTRMRQRTKLAGARAEAGPAIRGLVEGSEREALEW